MRGDGFLGPAALFQLGVKVDRLALEVAEDRSAGLTAFDGAQHGRHRFGRRQAAQIDIHAVAVAPKTRAVGRGA